VNNLLNIILNSLGF